MKDIGTRPLHRLLPRLLALSGLVPAHAQDVLYWTGGAGSWHDARMWSTTPQGPGGAGVPSDRTAVHIGGDPVIHVRVDRSARCGDLLVEARLLEFEAAVRRDQGLQGEALALLKRASTRYLEAHEFRLLSRVLGKREQLLREAPKPGILPAGPPLPS